MSYSIDEIEAALEARGELILKMESDGYDEDPELHLHDTTFNKTDNGGEIIKELSDGEMTLTPDRIETVTIHQQSTEDLGL